MHSDDFERLVLAHKGRLFRLAKWMLHNNEDAEDVLQDVFIKLWKMRSKLDGYRSIEALSMEITKNMCLNKIKKKKIAGSDKLLETVRSNETRQDLQLELAEKMEAMEQVISRLPEQQQMVLQLKGVEGMETREIAQVLDETDNNVRVILSRARKVVREAFKKYSDEG